MSGGNCWVRVQGNHHLFSTRRSSLAHRARIVLHLCRVNTTPSKPHSENGGDMRGQNAPDSILRFGGVMVPMPEMAQDGAPLCGIDISYTANSLIYKDNWRCAQFRHIPYPPKFPVKLGKYREFLQKRSYPGKIQSEE